MKKILFILLISTSSLLAQITFPSGFDVVSPEPLDTRFIVADDAARDAIVNLYNGLSVYQTDDSTYYYYHNSAWYKSPVEPFITVSGDGTALPVVRDPADTNMIYDPLDSAFATGHNWVGVGSLDISKDTIRASADSLGNYYDSDFSSDLDGWALTSGGETSTWTLIAADTAELAITALGGPGDRFTPLLLKQFATPLTIGLYYTLKLEYTCGEFADSGFLDTPSDDRFWLKVAGRDSTFDLALFNIFSTGRTYVWAGFTAADTNALFAIGFDGYEITAGYADYNPLRELLITRITIYEETDSTTNYIKLPAANFLAPEANTLYTNTLSIKRGDAYQELDGNPRLAITILDDAFTLPRTGTYQIAHQNINYYLHNSAAVGTDILINSNTAAPMLLSAIGLEEIDQPLTPSGNVTLNTNVTVVDSKLPRYKQQIWTGSQIFAWGGVSLPFDAANSHNFHVILYEIDGTGFGNGTYQLPINNTTNGDIYKVSVDNRSSSAGTILFTGELRDKIKWAGGSQPEQPANSVAIYTIWKLNDITFYGTIQQNFE